MKAAEAAGPGLRLSWVALAVVAAATACAAAAPSPGWSEVFPGATRQERVFHSPGGQTLIEQWSVAGESVPRAVRAQRYVSGLSLAPRLALVFHANHRVWMLSLDGRLTALSALPASGGASVPTAPGASVIEQYTFDHGGQRWHLAILAREAPAPLPGVATEQEQSLDLLLWRSPPPR
jgi:hypothetical protein